MPRKSTPDAAHYIADGHRVALRPSPDFVAVSTPGGASSTLRGQALGTEGVLVLADRELMLVPAARAAVASAIEDGVRAEGAEPARPTVFETDEAPGVYLVPNGEVVVKVAEGTDDDALAELLQRHGAEFVRSDYPEPGAHLVRAAGADATLTLADDLHGANGVEFAEPNFVQVSRPPSAPTLAPGNGTVAGRLGEPVDTMAPDPAIGSQWGLGKIRAIDAWAISSGIPSISVAVIDEGVDTAHEDLALALPGYDAYQGDDNPNPSGNDAHGTACSGIVSAIRDNGRGGSGVAPNCRVMPVRIAKGIGGGFWDTDSAKVADGIRTAVNRGAAVLSNSYRVGPSTLVTNAFAHAATTGRGGRGCVIAAATGNDDQLGVSYPARLSPSVRGMLAVGASNEWDQRKSKTSLDGETWWGSNFGPEVDVVAPGVHIHTTDITGAAGYSSGNYVPGFNGTSSATPHAAGVAALVLSVDPGLRGWEVEDILKLTARDLGAAGRDQFTGFGRVDARRALEAASRLWYTITPAVEFIDGHAFMRVHARLYNSGINRVRLDSFTLTSHTADWSAQIDRFEYRPNPGGVMPPRTGQDVTFPRILLKANGTRASWSYRWSASWTYTHWRPSTPILPMVAGGPEPEAPLDLETTQEVATGSARDGAEGAEPGRPGAAPDVATAGRSEVQLESSTRSVTIIVR